MKLPRPLLQGQNDMATMLRWLYSPVSVQAYGEMAADDFSISWGEMSGEEANALLIVLGAAEQTEAINKQSPGLLSLMPIVVLQGLSKAYVRLNPYKSVLTKIRDGEITRLEAKILAGEIAISRNEGTTLSGDQLTNLVANAA